MCIIDFDEPAVVWEWSRRRARLPHCCEVCRCSIEPGTVYLRLFAVFDGDAHGEPICGACEIDYRLFTDAHAEMNPGSFLDYLSECVSDGDPESDARWRPMLDRIRARAAASKVVA